MEDEKLIIDGKTYTVDNLDQLLASLNVLNLTSKSNEDYFAFFRELNPLSNFHPANFVLHGCTFTSTEQYIQYRKVSYFDDFVTANKIANMSIALECKELARQIKDFNKSQWETVAKDQCKPGIECKFKQNPSLMDLLLNLTVDKLIVESTGDRFWGTGVPLHRDDCLNRRMWTGQGLLGEILCEIRDDYVKNKKIPQALEHTPVEG